jgi:hypothetical protein
MPENTDATCSDHLDNNCDGKIDCQDTGCDLLRCAPAGKFCTAGQCVAGCIINSKFVAAGTLDPTQCRVCDPQTNDTGWSPVTDGAGCSANGVAGQCHRGACCAGCWDAAGNRCRTGGDTTACGTGGVACNNCVDNNPCSMDACTNGSCTHAPRPDGVLCGAPDGCGDATACLACLAVNAGVGCVTGTGACVQGVCNMTRKGVSCCATGCCHSLGGGVTGCGGTPPCF